MYPPSASADEVLRTTPAELVQMKVLDQRFEVRRGEAQESWYQEPAQLEAQRLMESALTRVAGIAVGGPKSAGDTAFCVAHPGARKLVERCEEMRALVAEERNVSIVASNAAREVHGCIDDLARIIEDRFSEVTRADQERLASIRKSHDELIEHVNKKESKVRQQRRQA